MEDYRTGTVQASTGYSSKVQTRGWLSDVCDRQKGQRSAIALCVLVGQNEVRVCGGPTKLNCLNAQTLLAARNYRKIIP